MGTVIGVNPYVLEWLNLIRHSLAEIPLESVLDGLGLDWLFFLRDG